MKLYIHHPDGSHLWTHTTEETDLDEALAQAGADGNMSIDVDGDDVWVYLR